MEKKPVSFWICLGVAFIAVVLLSSLTSLPLYSMDASQVQLWEGTELSTKLAVISQQRISLGSVGVYLAACLLDLPFGLLATVVGGLLGGLVLGSFHYLVPTLLCYTGIFLTVKLAGLNRAKDWKSSMLVVLLCAGWSVLVYFLYDMLILGLGYHLACIGFVSHMGEGLVCAGAGLLMLRVKQSRMVEKGELNVPIQSYASEQTESTVSENETKSSEAPLCD